MKYFSWFCFQIVWRTDYTFSMPPCLSFVRNIFASGRQATLVTDSCPPCGCRVQATRSFGTRFLWSISQKLVNPNMTRESIYVYIYNQNISMIYYIYSNVCIYIYVFPRTINHSICNVSAIWLVASFTIEQHWSFCHLPFGSALGANIFWRFIPGHLQLRFTRPSLFSVSNS
jgi:hypothetical protein